MLAIVVMPFVALAVLPAAAAYTLMNAAAVPRPTVAMPRRTGALLITMNDEATRDAELSTAALSRLEAAQNAALEQFVTANNMYPSEPIRIGSATVRPYIPEEPKKDSSQLGLEASRELAQAASQASKPKGDVAWASSLVSDKLFSLTAWNSPQIDVPHFYWAVTLSEATLKLTIDFMPRAAAGYDTALADGSYPEPTNREMFMMGSTRKELAEAFYDTDGAVEWLAGLKAQPGAVAASPASVPVPCSSPLLLDVELPLSEAAVDVACAACADAAARWSGWMAAAEKLEQRKIMMVFAIDSKTRAMCLGATTQALEALYGAEGRTIAMADAGPMDIVDRGSAQNSAAATNFDSSEKDATARDMQALVDQGNAMPPTVG